jgi:acetyl-CoA synthetase
VSCLVGGISIPHRIKGEGICCFVTLADGAEHSAELEKQLVLNVRSQIGAFATPDVLVIVPDLPKVRAAVAVCRRPLLLVCLRY